MIRLNAGRIGRGVGVAVNFEQQCISRCVSVDVYSLSIQIDSKRMKFNCLKAKKGGEVYFT